MKRILILTAIAMLSSLIILSAQTKEPEINTLFGGTKMKHSGYIGLQVKGTQIDDKLGFLIGGKAGWLMNRTFTIGLAGFGNVPTREYNFVPSASSTDTLTTGNRYFGYGGVYFEYILNPLDLIHFTGNVLIGAGGASYNNTMRNNLGPNNDSNMMDNTKNNPYAVYFIVEPEISAEMNLTKFMKVGVAVSYRIATMVDKNSAMENARNQQLKDAKLGGLAGSLYFNFGWF